MEYRDLPRIVAPDDGGDDLGPRPRQRRFPLARPGRLDARKIATVGMLALSLAAVIFYAGRQALDASVEWLQNQPRYQLPFGEIQLPEPPPDCFRGGTAAFLERVRRNAKEPEVVSLLKVDPVRLRNAFKAFPWVESVGEIERPPGGLVVHLKYRRPVAKVAVSGAGNFVLDAEGCVLPLEDIDAERVGRLIWIVGNGLTAPPRERAGTIWRTAPADSAEVEGLDRAVVEGAKLAAFLLDPSREADTPPDARVYSITVTEVRGDPVLFVVTDRTAQIQWGRGPGDEEPGELTAVEKWDLLVQQARRGLDQKDPHDLWLFNRSGMVYRPARPAR
ncbi:hypothetical protein [Paludisphaera sp.]|uniref:cell division protein FtsQ/DivIB n=1 Tax=Paludisphaera sp. TaxID=2017432 RepID=UPI00301C38AD